MCGKVLLQFDSVTEQCLSATTKCYSRQSLSGQYHMWGCEQQPWTCQTWPNSSSSLHWYHTEVLNRDSRLISREETIQLPKTMHGLVGRAQAGWALWTQHLSWSSSSFPNHAAADPRIHSWAWAVPVHHATHWVFGRLQTVSTSCTGDRTVHMRSTFLTPEVARSRSHWAPAGMSLSLAPQWSTIPTPTRLARPEALPWCKGLYAAGLLLEDFCRIWNSKEAT